MSSMKPSQRGVMGYEPFSSQTPTPMEANPSLQTSMFIRDQATVDMWRRSGGKAELGRIRIPQPHPPPPPQETEQKVTLFVYA